MTDNKAFHFKSQKKLINSISGAAKIAQDEASTKRVC
jgi:hypothetical protein